MSITYETTAKITEDGHLLLDITDLPFEKGTQFLVKLIPQVSFHPKMYKDQMQAFIEECAKNTPYRGMSKDQILNDLTRQREEMSRDSSEN